MKSPLAALFGLVLLTASQLSAAEFKKPVTSLDLQDGDTLVFLGDSITHQCLYTQYVEDYFYTRFPGRRIRFHNAGVSGDKAADALVRFEPDVAGFKPKYVTVLLGMNDGSYRHFDHEIFKTYEQGMTGLANRLAAAGATAIFMGPPMYDSRVASAKPPRWLKDQEQVKQATMYYNAVLAFYGTWVRDLSLARGLGYVDLLGPLNFHSNQQRLENPEFTVIPDAVHPDANGQAIMAFELLEQMNAGRGVSGVTANLVNGKWRVTAGKDKVADAAGDAESLQFTFTAGALPWVLPAEAKVGYELTKAGHKLSNERVVVRGLKPGKYALKIDGAEVGQFTHAQLGAKIELQGNDRTPQYQQALAVAKLNQERNEKAVKPLRNLWSKMKGQRRNEKLAQDKAAWAKWQAEFDAEVAKLLALKADYEERIHKLAQPRARAYELTLVQ